MTAADCDKLRLSRDNRGLSPRQKVAFSATTGDRLLNRLLKKDFWDAAGRKNIRLAAPEYPKMGFIGLMRADFPTFGHAMGAPRTFSAAC